MAFTLIAEFPGPVDWRMLNEVVQPYTEDFEFVPMPEERFGNPNSLALSVPFKQADPHAWEKLVQAIGHLRQGFHARLFDMYEGTELLDSMLHDVERRFLGE